MLPNVTIIGNLSKIETKVLQSGKKMTSFQVEASEKNAKGEYQNLYLKGEVWEKSSDFVSNYFNDGSVAIVTGKLYTNVYQKQDGTKAYENKLLFPSISFAPKEKGVPQIPPKQVRQQHQQVEQFPDMDIYESEIPF